MNLISTKRGQLGGNLSQLGVARGGSSRSSLLTNLVSYWPLHEFSGTRFDSTASGNNLTSNKSVGAVMGPQPPTIPYAASFNGSNQYLSVASNASLQTGNVDFFVAAWVNTTAADSGVDIAARINGSPAEYLLAANDSGNAISAYHSSDFQEIDISTFPGSWTFALMWQDATANTWNLRVNNGSVSSVTITTTITAGSSSFNLGSRNGSSNFFTGPIGPVFFGKLPPSGIASVISTINSTLYNGGAGILPSQLTSAQIAAWGLVSGWGCQDNGTSTYADSIGTNTLTNNNSVTRTTGVAYNAANFVEFNGQYLSIADNTSLDQFTNKLTTAGWVNFADISQQPILINKYQYATSGWNLQVGSSGQVYFFFGNGSAIYGVTANGVISTGNLYHIGAVYDGTQLTNATRLKIYVNGVSQSLTFSGTVPSSITTNTGPLVLGSYSFPGNPGNYMDGVMDDVGLWASALTQSQITALYGPGYPTVGTTYPFPSIA